MGMLRGGGGYIEWREVAVLFQRVLYLGYSCLSSSVLILRHSAIQECQRGYETLGRGSFIISPLLYTGRTF